MLAQPRCPSPSPPAGPSPLPLPCPTAPLHLAQEPAARVEFSIFSRSLPRICARPGILDHWTTGLLDPARPSIEQASSIHPIQRAQPSISRLGNLGPQHSLWQESLWQSVRRPIVPSCHRAIALRPPNPARQPATNPQQTRKQKQAPRHPTPDTQHPTQATNPGDPARPQTNCPHGPWWMRRPDVVSHGRRGWRCRRFICRWCCARRTPPMPRVLQDVQTP